MTENEAIEILTLSDDMKKILPTLREVYEVVVKGLQELQQYRNLGTIEFLTDMKSNYVEVLSDLRQYQKIGTVEECQQNKAIAEESIHKEHLVTTTSYYTEDRWWYGPDTWQCGYDTK